MKLTRLSLTNFRAFKKTQTLEFAPVTLLFGPNSVGKSTVLMALAYVQQILSKGHCDPQHLDALGKTNIGGFRSLVYGQDTSQSIILRVDYEVGNSIFEDYESDIQGIALESGEPFIQMDDLAASIQRCGIELEIAWSERFSRAYVKSYRIWINDECIGLLNASEDLKNTRISELNTQHSLLMSQDEKPSVMEHPGLKKNLELLEEELTLYESLSDKSLHAMTQGEMARLLESEGDIDSALSLFQEKLNVMEKFGDQYEHAMTQGEIALILASKGEVDSALELLQEKLNTMAELGEQYECAMTQGEIARILVSKGNVKYALSLLQEKLSVMDRLGNQYERAVVYREIAQLFVPKGDIDSAFFDLPLTEFEELLDELNPNSYSKPNSIDDKRAQVTFINRVSPISVRCSEAGAVPLLGEYFSLTLAGQDVEASSEHFNFLMVRQILSQAFVLPLDKLLEHLNNNIFIGPLRVIPDIDYQVNPHPEQSEWRDGSAAWDFLHRNPNKSLETKNLLKRVNTWLSSEKKLNTGYRLINYSMEELSASVDSGQNKLVRNLLKKRHISFEEESSGIHLSANQLGTGMSQVLPIVVAANLESTELVSVEQPELHIHPRLQVELADLFLEEASSKDKVFLIETHSEHLILRMLRRIREAHEGSSSEGKDIKPDDISVLYLSPGSEGVVVERQKITDDGDFTKDWPGGFFDERDEELF